jgi:tetratricopeptide (TPR) repeat protein
MSWDGLRERLLGVLDELAWVHAEGRLHLDVHSMDLGPTGAADSVRAIYCAPERLSGDPGLLGEWTDLYSVGCVAWEVACGLPPFEGRFREVLSRHAFDALPEFRPRLPLPAHFEGWVRRLLEKDPTKRFRRAGDAARALAPWEPSGALETEYEVLLTRPGSRRLELSGPGRWELAERVSRRAHVLGFTVLHARFGPTGTRGEGLEAMMARHLRLVGLDTAAATRRLGHDPTLAALLTGAPVRFKNVDERHHLLRRAIGGMGRRLVLRLDEVQDAPHIEAFVEGLSELDVLVLMSGKAGRAVATERTQPTPSRAAQLAAALGRTVDPAEFASACAEAGLPLAWPEGWGTSWAGGWSFHPDLRATLTVPGDLHAACARVATDPLRRSRHLLAAGYSDEAAPALADAARRLLDRGEPEPAEALMEERARALGGESPEDRLFRVRCKLARDDIDGARELLESLKQDGRRMAEVALELGRLDSDPELLKQALGRASDPDIAAAARLALYPLQPDLELLNAASRQARDPALQGRVHLAYGVALRQANITPVAIQHFVRAVEAFDAAGDRWGQAEAHLELGDALRVADRLEEAERHCLLSLAAWRDLGSAMSVLAQLKLGHVQVGRQRYEEARRTFLVALQILLLQEERPGSVAAVHVALLPCLAALKEWEAYDEHLEEAKAILDASDFADPDVAELAHLAAELCAGRRAHSTAVLAKEQLRRLRRS